MIFDSERYLFKVWSPRLKLMTEPFDLRKLTYGPNALPDDGIPLQFTGHLDKNGKKIFEKDVLEETLEDGTRVLKMPFWLKGYGFHIANINKEGKWFVDDICFDDAEIIFNLHEDDEFVEKLNANLT